MPHRVLLPRTPRRACEGREALDRVAPGTFRMAQRIVLAVGMVSGLLAFIGKPDPRKIESRSPVEEIVGPQSESVLLTPTAPPGPRWIEVSRWEDLVKASRFMGRPILRLDDGSRTPDEPLFYVPDGPQSYIFDFQREGVRVSNAGGYALSTVPEVETEVEPPGPVPPRPPERRETPSLNEPLAPEPLVPPDEELETPPREASDRAQEVIEQYLGPEIGEAGGMEEAPAKNKVDVEIREMIHDVLVKLRNVPAGSNRFEEASYHVQRALELLRLGRYGSAQIEVNRAMRLVHDSHRK